MAVQEEEKRSIGFKLFIISFELLVVLSILCGAWFLDKFLLAPPLIVSFRLIRVDIESKYAVWHLSTIFACMIVSTAICVFGVYVSLPICVSLITNIVVGAMFAAITWKIQECIDNKEKVEIAEKELEKFKNPYNVLMEKCLKAKLNERDTRIAILYFYHHLTPKEIWEWLCNSKNYEDIEWDSVYKIINRINKKFKKI